MWQIKKIIQIKNLPQLTSPITTLELYYDSDRSRSNRMLLKYCFLSKIICIHWLNEGATVCCNCCGKNLNKPPYVTIIVNPVLCPCVDKYVSFSYSKQHLCSIGSIILGLGWCGPAGRSLGRRCSRRCGFIGRWRLHRPKQRAKKFRKWIT